MLEGFPLSRKNLSDPVPLAAAYDLAALGFGRWIVGEPTDAGHGEWNTSMTRSQKIALITGASSGFGKSIAEALHARGFCVYGTTRAAPAPEMDGSYRSIAMDVDSDVTVAEGIARILREQGRIDVLVSNAGFGVAGAIEAYTEALRMEVRTLVAVVERGVGPGEDPVDDRNQHDPAVQAVVEPILAMATEADALRSGERVATHVHVGSRLSQESS